MNKKLIGLLATTSLAIAGVAFAQSSDVSSSSSSSSQSVKSKKSSDKGIGGSSMGTSSQTMGNEGQNEITGQVVEKKGSSVYVQDHMGAVVELKTDKSTKFEGIKRNDLKQGDQIRCSFDVRNKTENLAKSISLDTSTGTGGTGSDLGSQQNPSDMGGTGGSGTDTGSSSQSNQPDQSNY